MIYDLVIIGCGASGLACANRVKEKGLNYIALEANERAGKKILATGSGRCNLTNLDMRKEYYNTAFTDNVLRNYPPEKIIEFFERLGMKTKAVNNLVYPYTESANTVLNFLLRNVKEDIRCSYDVKEISKDKDIFIVNNEYKARNALFATGSNATMGYHSLAAVKALGHTYKEFKPSLVSLTTDTEYIKGLNGIRAKAALKLYKGQNLIAQERGEVHFKDNGISGIAAFMLTFYMEYDNVKDYDTVIDFTPDMDLSQTEKFALEGLVRERIMNNILKQAKDTAQRAAYTLKNFRLKVKGLGDIKKAQVCSGGLNCREFDPVTLQSKLTKGFYACGEALDVNGQCGGYNLHWAFASGLTAADNIK